MGDTPLYVLNLEAHCSNILEVGTQVAFVPPGWPHRAAVCREGRGQEGWPWWGVSAGRMWEGRGSGRAGSGQGRSGWRW